MSEPLNSCDECARSTSGRCWKHPVVYSAPAQPSGEGASAVHASHGRCWCGENHHGPASATPPQEAPRCNMCRDGNVAKPGPNGYMWHEFSGDDPEPCLAPAEPPEEAGRAAKIAKDCTHGAWAFNPDYSACVPCIEAGLRAESARLREQLAALQAMPPPCRKENPGPGCEHHDWHHERERALAEQLERMAEALRSAHLMLALLPVRDETEEAARVQTKASIWAALAAYEAARGGPK